MAALLVSSTSNLADKSSHFCRVSTFFDYCMLFYLDKQLTKIEVCKSSAPQKGGNAHCSHRTSQLQVGWLKGQKGLMTLPLHFQARKGRLRKKIPNLRLRDTDRDFQQINVV